MIIDQPLQSILIKNRIGFKAKYLKDIQTNGVIIYGTGHLAIKFYKFLSTTNIRIIGFTDHDPMLWGKELFGIKIKPINEVDRKHVVIVSIWSPNHSFRLTKKSLKQLGFAKILPPLSITFLFDDIGSIHYQIADFCLRKTDVQKIATILNCIRSDQSKKLYQSYVNWRLSLEDIYLPLRKTGPKYFLEEFFSGKEFNFVIDGGSYDGDTVKDLFFCKGNNFKKLHCFEPDINNFLKLSSYIESLSPTVSEKISIHHKGLNDKKKTAYFESSGKLGSKIIKDKSDTQVELITIDSLKLNNIDLIKLDIEGREVEALNGSRTTINEFHPSLAISIYHKPRDFIDIPFLLHKKFNYKNFEIVQYDNDGIDLTVLANQ